MSFYPFEDIVTEHAVPFFISRKTEGRMDPTQGNKWIPGINLDLHGMGAILPITSDDMKNEVNGVYTTYDRKIYTLSPLLIGDDIIYNDKKYKVHQEKNYQPYTDVFIYFAKAENRSITL